MTKSKFTMPGLKDIYVKKKCPNCKEDFNVLREKAKKTKHCKSCLMSLCGTDIPRSKKLKKD